MPTSAAAGIEIRRFTGPRIEHHPHAVIARMGATTCQSRTRTSPLEQVAPSGGMAVARPAPARPPVSRPQPAHGGVLSLTKRWR